VTLDGQSQKSKSSSKTVLPNGFHGADTSCDSHALELAQKLDASLDMIKHRGPDSRGQWISDDKRVGPRPPLAL